MPAAKLHTKLGLRNRVNDRVVEWAFAALQIVSESATDERIRFLCSYGLASSFEQPVEEAPNESCGTSSYPADQGSRP